MATTTAKPKKETKHEAAKTEPQMATTIPVDELTDAQKLVDLYTKHESMVNVLNNVIGYLNTLEQWRTASFKPKDDVQTETPATEGEKEA